MRFDNKNVVARACHCLLETRDELVEVDRDLSRAEKNPGVDKPADVWAEKFCEIFNDITEVFQVPCLDTILEGYDPETEPLGPGIRIGAAHAGYLRSMEPATQKQSKTTSANTGAAVACLHKRLKSGRLAPIGRRQWL